MKLTELLSDRGVEYHDEGGHHHARRGWIQVECFQCSSRSGKFRLGFNKYGKYWNCWSCGSVGMWDAIRGVLDLSDSEAKRVLASLDLESSPLPEIKRVGKLVLPKGLCKLQKPHREYLEKRGFKPSLLQRLWNVGGIGPVGVYKWRIFIPIHYYGKIVSWTTRSISDDCSAKYLTASPEQEEVSNHDVLGGEDYVRHCIIVNEGPLDAMAIGPGAVWTGGIGYSRAQLFRIAKYPVRVIAFDAEPAAQRRARKLCDALSVLDGETYNLVLSSGKDASRASEGEIRQIRRRFLGE